MFSSLANLLFGSSTNTSTNPESNSNKDKFENIASNSIESTAIGRRTEDNSNQNVSNHNKSIGDRHRYPIVIDNNIGDVDINDDYTNDDNHDEVFDDGWLLVNREDDEEDSLPRTDSEEELPFVEIKRSPTFQQRPRNTNHHHSLSAYHQRTLALRYEDGGRTQSLYIVPSIAEFSNARGNNHIPATISMEESWFLTPPPCFTSTGPINMETSPFENLLIEHPSMSVYHSIRSVQEAAQNDIDIDLGVEESSYEAVAAIEQPTVRNQYATQRTTNHRVQRIEGIENKMQTLARSAQKNFDKKERQTLSRGAIKRANKARELNGRRNRSRRSDMQNCRIVSGVNNNRKC